MKLISEMLRQNPEDRPDITTLKNHPYFSVDLETAPRITNLPDEILENRKDYSCLECAEDSKKINLLIKTEGKKDPSFIKLYKKLIGEDDSEDDPTDANTGAAAASSSDPPEEEKKE